jgi:hypothetical protein
MVIFLFYVRLFHVGKCFNNLPETLVIRITIDWAQFLETGKYIRLYNIMDILKEHLLQKK